MFLIGYSSKDRYTIVEPILFPLKHLGSDAWYDFTNMYHLGNNRYIANFEHRIGENGDNNEISDNYTHCERRIVDERVALY